MMTVFFLPDRGLSKIFLFGCMEVDRSPKHVCRNEQKMTNLLLARGNFLKFWLSLFGKITSMEKKNILVPEPLVIAENYGYSLFRLLEGDLKQSVLCILPPAKVCRNPQA
jgi:hypothetical protein